MVNDKAWEKTEDFIDDISVNLIVISLWKDLTSRSESTKDNASSCFSKHLSRHTTKKDLSDD